MNFRRNLSLSASLRKQNRRRNIYVVLTLFAGIFVFSLFRSPLYSLVAVIWRSENNFSSSIRNTLDLIKSKKALIKENEELKSKLKSTEILEESIRAFEDSQTNMLELFGRSSNFRFIAAGVLAHPPETPYDILIIDAGTKDGVRPGQKASLPYGGALGTVSEAFFDTSRVALYSGSGIETNAYLERGDVVVKLIGNGGGGFVLTLPRDVEVEVGDKILMPGVYTELVAVVEEVVLEPTDSSKRVLLRGVANVNNVRFVEVH